MTKKLLMHLFAVDARRVIDEIFCEDLIGRFEMDLDVLELEVRIKRIVQEGQELRGFLRPFVDGRYVYRSEIGQF